MGDGVNERHLFKEIVNVPVSSNTKPEFRRCFNTTCLRD